MADSCHSTRRAFLKSAAAASALPIAGCADAALAEELPVQKANRLGWELAHVLDEYEDGLLHAEIYPASKTSFAVGFKYDYPETQEEKVLRLIRSLQFEMSKLPTMETVGGLAHEITLGERSYLRLAHSKSDGDGLQVLVGFVAPLNT